MSNYHGVREGPPPPLFSGGRKASKLRFLGGLVWGRATLGKVCAECEKQPVSGSLAQLGRIMPEGGCEVLREFCGTPCAASWFDDTWDAMEEDAGRSEP